MTDIEQGAYDAKLAELHAEQQKQDARISKNIFDADA